jgi:hypothetical protein
MESQKNLRTPLQEGAWVFGLRTVKMEMYGAESEALTPPYNMPFESIALGRHGACLRKPHAGDAPAFHFPVEGLRPCSRFNGLLYGPIK